MEHIIDFAHSVQGANHIKVNKECQDSSGRYADDFMSVVVVADGHGSSNYPRTKRGSAFAVTAALNAIKEFVITAKQFGIDVYAEQTERFHDLSLNILKQWHSSVQDDLQKNPFLPSELENVSDSYKERYSAGIRCEKAYGTTLIAVCVTADYWFGLHIGDGKCVAVGQHGECFEPIPWDDNCQANITTSICDSDAIDEFRFFCGKEFPLGVFLGSDGIDDSYAGDAELHDLYRTILCLFAGRGKQIGENEIKDFLPNISRMGSGDDASMAGLIRSGISEGDLAWINVRKEYETAQREFQRLEKEAAIAEETVAYLQEEIQKARERLEHASASAGAVREDLIQRTNQTLKQAYGRLAQADSTRDQAAAKREKARSRLKRAEKRLKQLKASQDGTKTEDTDHPAQAAQKKRRATKKRKPAKKMNWRKRSKRKKHKRP